jgi:N utilization substance protein B|tara:strand:+ start:5392 stop:5793 length:402 start_codon:yes stop_codon:yes gene_type:complete
MSQKINKNSLPRVKIVQKIYNLLMNPNTQVEYPKSQYKKFIKDVVEGTLERSELIESTINEHLNSDIDLKKTDKLLKIVLFAAVFELLFKHNNPKKVIISEYVLASEYFLEKVQIGYLNAILDKISKVIRKDE